MSDDPHATPARPDRPAGDEAPQSAPGKVRTWWHPLLAGVLRWQLHPTYGVVEEVHVGTKPLQIDILLLRHEAGELPEDVRRLLAGLAECLNDYTLLELKGPTDTLRAGDFRTFLAYAHLYCAQNVPLLEPSRLSLVVLAPRLTRPYRKELRALAMTPEAVRPGVWRLRGPTVYTVWLLETAKLAGGGFPLLALFSPAILKERARIVRELRAQGFEPLLEYMLQQIQQFRLGEEESAMNRLSAEEVARLHQQIVTEYLANASVEERLKFLTPEQRLQDLSPKERVKSLSPEELLAALTPKQRAKLRAAFQQSPSQ